MVKQVVRLPLNSALQRALSSSSYDRSIEQGLGHLDILYTYFARYPCLFQNFESIANAKGSKGVTIDYTASHPVAALGLTLCFLAVSIGAAVKDFYAKKKKEEEEDNLYRQINQKTEQRFAKKSPLTIAEFNAQLALVLQESPELARKYRSISVTPDGFMNLALKTDAGAELSFKERLAKKLSTTAGTAWTTLGLASFVYWILWIGWGVLTGEFASAGVGSMGINSFIVPFAVALSYPLVKIANWWSNHYASKQKIVREELVQLQTDPSLQKAASNDLALILKLVVYSAERTRLAADLRRVGLDPVQILAASPRPIEALASDRKLFKLGKSSWAKAAASFVAVSISAFIGAQYVAWVVTDVLSVAANITINSAALTVGIGATFMAISGIYGLYKAYQRHQEVKQYQREVETFAQSQNNLTDSLEVSHERKLQEISQLQTRIIRHSRNPGDVAWVRGQTEKFKASLVHSVESTAKPAKSFWEKAGDYFSRFVSGLGGATGGVMIGRLFLFKKAGIMPFILVAGLSHPALTVILVGLGLVYGTFKAYLAYQDSKEAEAKAIFAKREDKISGLKTQCELADLQIALLNHKVSTLSVDDLSPKKQREPGQQLVPQSFFKTDLRRNSISEGRSSAEQNEKVSLALQLAPAF